MLIKYSKRMNFSLNKMRKEKYIRISGGYYSVSLKATEDGGADLTFHDLEGSGSDIHYKTLDYAIECANEMLWFYRLHFKKAA